MEKNENAQKMFKSCIRKIPYFYVFLARNHKIVSAHYILFVSMAKNKTAKKLPPQLAAWSAVMNEVKAAHPEYSLKKRMQAAKKIYRKSKKSRKSVKGGMGPLDTVTLDEAYNTPSVLADDGNMASPDVAVVSNDNNMTGGKKDKKKEKKEKKEDKK